MQVCKMRRGYAENVYCKDCESLQRSLGLFPIFAITFFMVMQLKPAGSVYPFSLDGPTPIDRKT